MEYLCRFNIVGDEKEFEGRLILDSDLFRLKFTETIPFNENIDKGDGIEAIEYYSKYWDRYNVIFHGGNKIQGYIIDCITTEDERILDSSIQYGKKGFVISSYRFGRSYNRQRTKYEFLFDSIIILSETIGYFPECYDSIDAEEVLCSSTVSEISWNYNFEYQCNFFRMKQMGLETSIVKEHSQIIFRTFLQEAYKISDEDFHFDTHIQEYNLGCFGKLSIDAWKLRKEQSNIRRLPLDCDVELSLKFNKCISIEDAVERVKCIAYFYNFILSDFNFPSQFRFLQDNNLFELKNNYNSASKFSSSRMNRFIIDERDIENIEELIKEWVHNYDKFFKIPFELYKNSCNLNNSNEQRLRYIITSLDSLFDRLKSDKLKSVYEPDVWKDIKKKIKNALPKGSPILEKVRYLNRTSLRKNINLLSQDFMELYEEKIEPEIRDSIPIRHWLSHAFKDNKFDSKLQIDDDFANFNNSDHRLSLSKKIYILQKIFEFNMLLELGIEKEILVEKINSDYIITSINEDI